MLVNKNRLLYWDVVFMCIGDEFNATLEDWINNISKGEFISIYMSNGQQYGFSRLDDVSFSNGLLIINKNTDNIINVDYSLYKINPAYIVSIEKSIKDYTK